MRIEIEWHLPWPASLTEEKRNQAADNVLAYMTGGTFYETTRRMQLVEAKKMGPSHNPMIHLTLEV